MKSSWQLLDVQVFANRAERLSTDETETMASWLNLNLNQSLSSLKGQLTSLASEALADSPPEPLPDEQSNHLEQLAELQSQCDAYLQEVSTRFFSFLILQDTYVREVFSCGWIDGWLSNLMCCGNRTASFMIF